jgi:glucan phosphoethanolaminetransferase (alkaline phosphatase superfamily)
MSIRRDGTLPVYGDGQVPRVAGRLFAAGVLLLSPYLAMFWWLLSHLGLQVSVDYVFVCVGGLLLLAVVARSVRFFLLLNFLLFVPCVVIVGYTIFCGQLPGYPIALILQTSSWEEVSGFFGIWEGQRLLLLVLGTWLGYLLLSLSIPASVKLPDWTPRLRRSVGVGMGLLAAYAALTPEQFIESAAASPAVGTAMFVSGPLSSADYQAHSLERRKRPYGAQRVQSKEAHILVIGESSRRASWSAYGYSRPTTPRLQAISSEIVFLNKAISDANATMYAVPILLTGIGPETFTPFVATGNLVNLAQEAGYFSVLLSNQDAGPPSLVGVKADVTWYTRPVTRVSFVVMPPDEILLQDFEQQIAGRSGPLFVVLHVYGSHSPYANRYPKSFAHFTAGTRGSEVDSYDDSILYGDWFLDQVIERARKLDIPVTLTYLSDHGEDLQQLDGRGGHGAGDYSPHAFEIPAFVWTNEAYRRTHPDKLAALVANASKEVRTHDFFYSLADLMGIRWPGFTGQRSFVSTQFLPDETQKHIAGGRLVIRPGAPVEARR